MPPQGNTTDDNHVVQTAFSVVCGFSSPHWPKAADLPERQEVCATRSSFDRKSLLIRFLDLPAKTGSRAGGNGFSRSCLKAVLRASAQSRYLACTLISLWGWLCPLLAQTTPSNQRTNVVVILADDLGWGDLGVYGHPKFKTPNLDRMAREGARLRNFYSPTPYCAPSRASLLTGRYPFRNGITGNPAPDAGINDIGIRASEITLGEAFQSAGYQTAIIGKWHLGHKPEFYPTRHGFHEYLGILYSNDMRPVQLIEGEKVVEYPLVQATLTKRYTERALSFIERSKDKPFFLYFPQAMPHKPLAASEEFYKKSGAGLYGDALLELDWSVGQVLEKLRQLRLDEKTLVIFTSDNGPWYGGSTGGLRGMKSNNWEGGLRVPLIARWPGKIPAGHVSDAPAIMMDLFPTTLKAAGIDLPTDRTIDGRDLFPLLTSKAGSQHEAIFSMLADHVVSVRSEKWKLHVVPPKEQRGLTQQKSGSIHAAPMALRSSRLTNRLTPVSIPVSSAQSRLRHFRYSTSNRIRPSSMMFPTNTQTWSRK